MSIFLVMILSITRTLFLTFPFRKVNERVVVAAIVIYALLQVRIEPMFIEARTDNIQNTYRTHTEHIQNTYRTHTEHIQNTYRAHTEHIQNTYRTHIYKTRSGDKPCPFIYHVWLSYPEDTSHLIIIYKLFLYR